MVFGKFYAIRKIVGMVLDRTLLEDGLEMFEMCESLWFLFPIMRGLSTDLRNISRVLGIVLETLSLVLGRVY